MTALKYSIESFNSQMKESVNLKISLLKFSSQRIKKKKRKRVKKAYGTYAIPSKEASLTLWEFQKEKRERKRENKISISISSDHNNMKLEINNRR